MKIGNKDTREKFAYAYWIKHGNTYNATRHSVHITKTKAEGVTRVLKLAVMFVDRLKTQAISSMQPILIFCPKPRKQYINYWSTWSVIAFSLVASLTFE